MSITTYIFFLVAILLLNTANGYPSGAGHCKEGDLSNKSYFTHGNSGSGSLSNGGLQVKVDANVLNTESKMIVEGGKTYKLVLEGGNFRGFLIRLAALDGRNVYEYLSESSSNIQRKRGDLCSTTVAAMTHTGKVSKSSIEIDLIVPALAGTDAFDLRLDVTVVIANGFGTKNAWHYDLYGLAVQEKATLNPTAAPTDAPTTKKPSISTKIPTVSTKTPSTSTKIPTTSTKTPSISTKIPTTSTKTPSTSTKIPTTSTKTPSTSTKIPTTSTKTPSTSTKIPTTSTKTPSISTKSPSKSTKYPTISTKYPSLPTNDARILKKISKEKKRIIVNRVRRRMKSEDLQY